MSDTTPVPQPNPGDNASPAAAKPQEFQDQLAGRHRLAARFEWVCLVSTWLGLVVLVVFLLGLLMQAWGWVGIDFLRRPDSTVPEQAGMLMGVWGSIWLILLVVVFTVPLGVGAAVYLEEYAADTWLRRLIQTNLANLSGVPSIVYGILGLTVFTRFFGLVPAEDRFSYYFPGGIEVPIPFGPIVLSGAATLSLLVLPVVIISAQEALRAVPPSIRHASLALGATPWQTIRHQVLPAAVPGIATGVILSVSRAIGETAPVLMVGAATRVTTTPGGIGSVGDLLTDPLGIVKAIFDNFTCMPVQIYNWVSQSKPAFYEHVAAAGILILLAILLVMNGIAIYIRNRFQVARW